MWSNTTGPAWILWWLRLIVLQTDAPTFANVQPYTPRSTTLKYDPNMENETNPVSPDLGHGKLPNAPLLEALFSKTSPVLYRTCTITSRSGAATAVSVF